MKKKLITGAIVASTALGVMGGLALNAIPIFAATDSTITAQTAPGDQQPTQTQTDPALPQGQPADQKDPSKGGHVGKNGTREELLTGDTAEKVKTAALKAVAGGTIQRVETDAEGAVYEAHMTKADGSRVTVKLDANFNVTSTEDGIH